MLDKYIGECMVSTTNINTNGIENITLFCGTNNIMQNIPWLRLNVMNILWIVNLNNVMDPTHGYQNYKTNWMLISVMSMSR